MPETLTHHLVHQDWCKLDFLSGLSEGHPHSPGAFPGRSLWWWFDESCEDMQNKLVNAFNQTVNTIFSLIGVFFLVFLCSQQSCSKHSSDLTHSVNGIKTCLAPKAWFKKNKLKIQQMIKLASSSAKVVESFYMQYWHLNKKIKINNNFMLRATGLNCRTLWIKDKL